MIFINNYWTPVLVLKSNNHWGLGILRSLGRLGIPVYTVNANPRTPAFFSRYCRRKFVCNIDELTDQSVRDLLNVGREIGRRSILIPPTDDGAIFVADHASPLREWFIFPNQRADLVHSLCSKKEMYFLAKKFRVPTPEAVFPESREDVLDFLENATFPIVMKPIQYWGRKKTGAIKIAHTKRELIENYDMMEDPEEPNLMLQEYIPGRDEDVWMFNGYFDQNSDCLIGFTGRKIRQLPTHRGVTSLGICQKNEIVEEMTKEFMKAVGYRGILDIGYRYDARDRQYKVLDINPRIGATFRLFVADSGMDVVRALYLDMIGQSVNPEHVPNGRKWVVEDLDLKSAFCDYLDGNLSLKQWIDSYRGVRENAFFTIDDLLPFVQQFRCLIRQLLSDGQIKQVSPPMPPTLQTPVIESYVSRPPRGQTLVTQP
jgi:D-aspartate ligase